MTKKLNKIWYASYGSNLLEKRFSCYIAGGTPPGAQRKYAGCTNRSLPEVSKPITINHQLYFARRSKTWHGGGVAFIKPDPDPAVKTLGRMYLITAEQFTEVVKQEIRLEGDLIIDLDRLVKEGCLTINDHSWYNRLVFLGFEDEAPIFTFTNSRYLKDELNPPHSSYLQMISSGLKETYGMSEEEAGEYVRERW